MAGGLQTLPPPNPLLNYRRGSFWLPAVPAGAGFVFVVGFVVGLVFVFVVGFVFLPPSCC